MGSFKPFIFGTAFGAGLAFVALQFHVIQSKDGFRVVPRTPQHSLGLAYADVRNWDAEQWADRPELVKALVADGSTNLVAGSVADSVIDAVSPDGSTLDQLRNFLDESPNDPGNVDSLFDSPGLTIPSTGSVSDQFTVPFPNDAKRPTLDMARKDVKKEPTRTSAKPSIQDVYSAGIDRLSGRTPTQNRNTGTTNAPTAPATSALRETELLEDMLFGDDNPTTQSGNDDDAGFGIFEDVTGSLEDQAAEVMKRARTGARNETNRAVEDSVDSFKRFIRDKTGRSLPESVKGMFSADTDGQPLNPGADVKHLPDAIKALRDGFDPFVE